MRLPSLTPPRYRIFIQHGWNDDHRSFQTLAALLSSPDNQVITPNLGLIETWLGIDPLIDTLTTQLAPTINADSARIRVVAHSLGGLIWLTLLDRQRHIWERIESLVLLGSPVGGSDLARIIDPFGSLPTIARDLGRNYRPLAEQIAHSIPTLVITGNSDQGSDGVITTGSTYIEGARNIRMPGINHNMLRSHRDVVEAILRFWGIEQDTSLLKQLRRWLQNVPGMTDAHERDFPRATIIIRFRDGTTIRTWKNPAGVDHVFVADPAGLCYYGGFVGWVHAAELQRCLSEIQHNL